MHKIDFWRPSVLFCHLLRKCRIPVTEQPTAGISGEPMYGIELLEADFRKTAKRTNFGIPNEINAVRFPGPSAMCVIAPAARLALS
jgi:hypothetical protein